MITARTHSSSRGLSEESRNLSTSLDPADKPRDVGVVQESEQLHGEQLHGMNININGILLLHKPQDMTSQQAVHAMKRLFHAEKAGHTGTLDPMATGMLPICFGEATKFSQFLLEQHKTYEATGVLGSSTTTGDAWGEVVQHVEKTHCEREALETALSQHVGFIDQIPPMYSALKHQGKPLYWYARQGQDIPRDSRRVEITHLDLIAFDGHTFKIRTTVSKGTYIRTLIETIGLALGSVAHMSQLHRVATMGFHENEMVTQDALNAMTAESRGNVLRPASAAVAALEKVCVSAEEKVQLYQGREVAHARHCERSEATQEPSCVSLWDHQDQFFGVGTLDPLGHLKAKRLWRIE